MRSSNRLAKFFGGRYNVMLVCLALLFMVRPNLHTDIYPIIWKTVLIIALLFGIYNSHHSRLIKIIVSIFALPTIVFTAITVVHLNPLTEGLMVFSTTLFLFFCTISVVHDVIIRARVTLETLLGVISAYFLVAFIFAYIYLMIEYLNPGSIQLHDKNLPIIPIYGFLSEMLYFSFITLLTIGFGDIVPVTHISQTFVVMEGIIGQFYIAMLVARIISVYSALPKKE